MSKKRKSKKRIRKKRDHLVRLNIEELKQISETIENEIEDLRIEQLTNTHISRVDKKVLEKKLSKKMEKYEKLTDSILKEDIQKILIDYRTMKDGMYSDTIQNNKDLIKKFLEILLGENMVTRLFEADYEYFLNYNKTKVGYELQEETNLNIVNQLLSFAVEQEPTHYISFLDSIMNLFDKEIEDNKIGISQVLNPNLHKNNSPVSYLLVILLHHHLTVAINHSFLADASVNYTKAKLILASLIYLETGKSAMNSTVAMYTTNINKPDKLDRDIRNLNEYEIKTRFNEAIILKEKRAANRLLGALTHSDSNEVYFKESLTYFIDKEYEDAVVSTEYIEKESIYYILGLNIRLESYAYLGDYRQLIQCLEQNNTWLINNYYLP